MNRRDFGLLTGSSLVTAAALRPANAQSFTPDPTLLTTTLTPMGAERAGNADGTIPAWTGGMVSTPTLPNQPGQVQLFQNEQPLYTVDASNIAQYEHLLSEGTKAQINNFGLSLKVYPTHRTAAAPQYVYDNTAKNVTRAQFDPAGGRFGIVGAYGGVPFPIIDTSDPYVGGLQLIWNHLTAWACFSNYTSFAPGCVVIHGKLVLVDGAQVRSTYPYYDPDGSPDSFDGYYYKSHAFTLAPSGSDGQENVVWFSLNIKKHPDIIWQLLNGQGRVRKAPNLSYDTPSPASDGIANIDESTCFFGNPSQYDWRFIEKKELLVPYNCNALLFMPVQQLLKAHFPDPEYVRWEKHRVWIVEATLHPGERNVNSKRRFYIDEDSWAALLGEGYDSNNALWKAYGSYNACFPSIPSTAEQQVAVYSMLTGDYWWDGSQPWTPYSSSKYIGPQDPSYFEPQEMAAKAAF